MSVINSLPTRIRHETRIRQLQVAAVTDITPLMRRVTLAGPDLAGFTSLGYDDHIKMFFPPVGGKLVLPTLGPDGLVFDGPRPPMRDYTPRRYDPAAQTLDLDFVLHGDGPASSWAAGVKVGDVAVIAGPRGSMVVPNDYDWYLLAGDETALPAIGRRLEELPASARAIVLVEVANPGEEQNLASAAEFSLRWLHRNGAAAGATTLLQDALRQVTLPEGRGFAFVAGEARLYRDAKQYLIEERGLPPELVKAAGYWALGEADVELPH